MKKNFVIFFEIAFSACREPFEEFLSKTCWFFRLVWFFRQNLLNSRRKYFSNRQKCILSQNFPNFGETFQQNRQKGILNVQRNTFRKTICWLCETTSDFGQGIVLFAAEILQPCYQICTFVSGWAIGRIVLKEFLFFWFFRTSREHFLVFSLYHSRHGGPNWIPPAKRNISIRKNFKRKFLSSPDYERSFLNLHWSLLGMLSKLQFTCSKEHFEKGYLFRILQNCFRTLSDNRPDPWRKFQQRFQMCILRVRRTFLIFCEWFSCFI